MRDTLFHIMRVEDFWVNEFLRGGPRMVLGEDRESVNTTDELESLWSRVSDATMSCVKGLSPEELREVRERGTGEDVIRKTVEEYLFTFLIHEVYHKGEVLAVMWHMGVEPPHLDDWSY